VICRSERQCAGKREEQSARAVWVGSAEQDSGKHTDTLISTVSQSEDISFEKLI